MKAFHYASGVEVKAGDRITYRSDAGEVEFVAIAKTGDPALDWYLDEFPGGGVMITAEGFGSVFIEGGEIADEEDLEFVARSDGTR